MVKIVEILAVADFARGSGHYDVALETMGMVFGMGRPPCSTLMAGAINTDGTSLPDSSACTICALVTVMVLWLFIPEAKSVTDEAGRA